MKLRLFCSFILIFLFFNLQAQRFYRNSFEFNVELGISNDLSSSTNYNTRSLSGTFTVDDRWPTRVRNLNFAFTRFINRKNGFHLSYGETNFGFNIKGNFDQNGVNFREKYSIKYLELGLSYVRIISNDSFGNYIFKPGILILRNSQPIASIVSIFARSAFSFSLYAGYEFPMLGDQFFTSIGLQLKIPMMAYNRQRSNLVQPDFYPYFLGLKVGFNFQNKAF